MLIGISGKAGSGKDLIARMIQHRCAEYISKDGTLVYDFDPSVTYNHWSSWKIKKYASKLKQIVSILTGIPIADLEKEEVKNSTLPSEWNTFEWLGDVKYDTAGNKLMTVRKLLQIIGTEAMRNNVHENVWVNALFSEYINSSVVNKESGFVWDFDHKEAIGQGPYTNNCMECKSLFRGYKRQYLCASCASIERYPKWIITDVRFLNEAKAVLDRGGILLRVNRPGNMNPAGEHPSETSLDDYKLFNHVIENEGTIEELYAKVTEFLTKFKFI